MSRSARPGLLLRGRPRLALGLFAAGLAGCIAPDVDPAGDIQAASALVAERSDWTPSWSRTPQDDTTSWDGRSPLTAAQAVTIALQNNRNLRAQLEGIASAKADLAQSGLLPNPVLSIDAAESGVGNPLAIGLVQDLAQLWLRPSQEDAAGQALLEQVQTVSDLALRLVADVRKAHLRVVHGQRGTALMQAQLALVRRALDAAQRRADAGEGTQLDVNVLREELLSNEADLEAQELELGTARRDLLALLGMAAAGAGWTAAEDDRPPDAALTALTEDDAVARALRLRLDVQAARAVFEQRSHELHAASLGLIPDISLGPEYARNEDGVSFRGGSLEAEVPFFDLNQPAVAKAESDLRRAAAEADQVRQDAVNQTRTAFLALQSNLRLAQRYREQVLALARDNQDLAQRSYEAGEADLSVLLDTQRELNDSESRMNDLQLDLATSAVDLEYAVGGKL